MISTLAPANVLDYDAHLECLVASGTMSAFDPIIVDFIDAVSKSVLLDPAMRSMPEMMAAAHWMRKAHILDLKRIFEAGRGDRILLPRGVALHFAPSNVDSIFIYSWFTSMLLGNANIVRLSSRRGRQVDALLETVNAISAEKRYRDIRDRTLILSYDHDDALTHRLSELCHIRLLWGGDDSIRALRAVPLNPLATEVSFANRFSMAVLNASAVACCAVGVLKDLARRFYNDAYWFDQMACSSPRLLVWVGRSETCASAQHGFWPALADEVKKRGAEYADIIGLNKQVAAYVSAAKGLAAAIMPGVTGPISRIQLRKDADGQYRDIECGGGLFFEMEIASLNDLVNVVTSRDQTVSHFGFEAEELKRLAVTLPSRAVDRIVPVGTALEFSPTWDGSDLLQILSRQVEVRA